MKIIVPALVLTFLGGSANAFAVCEPRLEVVTDHRTANGDIVFSYAVMIGHIPIGTVIAREYKLFEYGEWKLEGLPAPFGFMKQSELASVKRIMTAGEALYVYLREDTPARDVVSLRDLLVNWYTDHQPLAKK